LLFTLAAMSGAANAAAQAPADCGPDTRRACVYTPELTFASTAVFDTVLTDPARHDYELPVRVRYPEGASGPLPVVIYNHGGDASNVGGFSANSQPWPTLWAEHGYVVISPSRALLDHVGPAQEAECAVNEVPPGLCNDFIAFKLYGPLNTDFLIESLPQLASLHPPLTGLLDGERVVVAGWSGGSTIVLANAGAPRQFVPAGPVYHQKTRRPMGFFAMSAQGPDYAGFGGGFDSESYDQIDARPFVTFTGKGDTNGKPSETRTTAWLRSAPGQKFLSFDRALNARHGTMNRSLCLTSVQASHCAWMESAGLAFLDAVTRRRPEAIEWLASDAYQILTAGEIELHRR
jgi:dienelactone hydrolase